MLVDALHDISLEFKEEEARPGLVGAIEDLAQFRAIVVVALAASVWITWPMWGPRDYPIILPVANLPQVTLAPILIAACLLALVAPRPGSMVITLVFTYGMATDQSRMRPVLSLPLLLWGSLPSASARLVGRFSLISSGFLPASTNCSARTTCMTRVRGW